MENSNANDFYKKLMSAPIDEVESLCKSVGVKITDDNGNYRATYDVLNDLSKYCLDGVIISVIPSRKTKDD